MKRDEAFRQHITVRAIPAVKVDTRCTTPPEAFEPVVVPQKTENVVSDG